MIDVFFTHFNAPLTTDTWNTYFQKLPQGIQTQIMRFKRWQDRNASLLGKILLLEGLKQYGYPSDFLDNLSYSPYNRPFLDDSIDFNISHSGEYVVCAINNEGRVGIDIERMRPLDFSEFRNYMTSEEWNMMHESPDQLEYFYELWTVKESVIKGEGKGLSIPLLDIHWEGETASVSNNLWYIRKILIDPGYSCHVAANHEISELHTHKV